MFLQTFAFCHTRETNTNLGPAKLWDVEPELPDLDMTLNARSHMTLFDAESPIGGSSSGHGSNAPTFVEDVVLYDRIEDIFDYM